MNQLHFTKDRDIRGDEHHTRPHNEMNRSVIEGGSHHHQLQKTPRLSEFQPQGMPHEG
jgi:hypothetical protein